MNRVASVLNCSCVQLLNSKRPNYKEWTNSPFPFLSKKQFVSRLLLMSYHSEIVSQRSLAAVSQGKLIPLKWSQKWLNISLQSLFNSLVLTACIYVALNAALCKLNVRSLHGGQWGSLSSQCILVIGSSLIMWPLTPVTWPEFSDFRPKKKKPVDSTKGLNLPPFSVITISHEQKKPKPSKSSQRKCHLLMAKL